MKLRITATLLTALLLVMSMPFAVCAQGYDHYYEVYEYFDYDDYDLDDLDDYIYYVESYGLDIDWVDADMWVTDRNDYVIPSDAWQCGNTIYVVPSVVNEPTLEILNIDLDDLELLSAYGITNISFLTDNAASTISVPALYTMRAAGWDYYDLIHNGTAVSYIVE